MVARAGLPAALAPRLAAAATEGAAAAAARDGDAFGVPLGDARLAVDPTRMYTRDDLDALARRAGLPMGQRLRLKNAWVAVAAGEGTVAKAPAIAQVTWQCR